MEDFWPSTTMLCGEIAGFKVTVNSRTELTATDTSASACANPVALTDTRYFPGGRSSTRNSPRSSLSASRRNTDSADCTSIFAPGILAPDESCTAPRIDPLGLCASACPNTREMKTVTAISVRSKSLPLDDETYD